MFDLFVYHNFTSTYKVRNKVFNNLAEAENYAKIAVKKYKEVVIYKNDKPFSFLQIKNGKLVSRKIYNKE